jgi:hypothetical protein
MYSGEFLETYFYERGPFEPNTQGEASVMCPFPHDKGFETRPSAHVNLKKSLFHCKTCQAEGRFNDGGLSEIGFIAKLYNLSYEQAVQMMSTLQSAAEEDSETWSKTVDALLDLPQYVDYLKGRGIIEETIRTYQLGYTGDGIRYPVLIYNQLCDIRTYMPDETPKMRSQKGASPLLFPFDVWRLDDRPTLLVAGENDCLLGRQMGFNALTVTGGEGAFPKILLGTFKGKTVYICYDLDEAGIRAARKVSFLLHEAGAEVHVVNLGLSGTKEDKDLTDFVVKHGFGADELTEKINQAVRYTEDMFAEGKNEHYPLVDLWDVPEGKYSGRRISSRVALSGKYDTAMQAPTAVEWVCRKPDLESDKSPCHGCRLRKGKKVGSSGWWTLDENLKDLMELVEVTEPQQQKALNKFIKMPDKCPNGYKTIKARQSVYKVVFTPDVETEDILTGFRAVEQYAYTVGLNLEDGARYRAYFKAYAHPLNGQRVFMVVDRVEESDNAINTFQMNDEIKEQLKIFQGPPSEMMHKRAEMAKDIVGGFTPEMIVYAVDLMYHSPLKFKFTDNGKKKELKGYPEGLIVGDTRTGKSSTTTALLRHYGIGNFTSVKRATTAGLLGGADKLPSGGFKVTWGTIPRNNKGLVFLDEMSDCALDVIASLTDMRSSGTATVNKMAKGKAPAHTRMLWLSNPRKNGEGHNMAVQDYPTGVSIVTDLVGATEDIARFDFIMLITDNGEVVSPLDVLGEVAHPSEAYRNLIYWVWSRTSDQIIWEEGVEGYVWQISQELNEKYNTDVKFFGAEAWKKLARIAVACAANCFSCSADGSSIVVTKLHVDWAARFLAYCYDNKIFRLAEYVKDRRVYNETNESVNAVVAGMCRSYPMVIKSLLQTTQPYPRFNLQAISGLENNDFNKLMSTLTSNYLVTASPQGFLPTRRLRKATDLYRNDYQKTTMVPLSSEGGSPV